MNCDLLLVSHSDFLLHSDDDPNDANQNRNRSEPNSLPGPPVGANPFLEISQNIPTVEYKKGYVMRKCCVDPNNKKSELMSTFCGDGGAHLSRVMRAIVFTIVIIA